jgi:hypothetical protein
MLSRFSLLPVAFAVVLASACSTSPAISTSAAPASMHRATVIPVTSQRASVDATAGRGWLYISNSHPSSGNAAVFIYKQAGHNQQPFDNIVLPGNFTVPGCLFVDRLLNLYVCDNGGPSVYVYPAGGHTPSLTLTGAQNTYVEALVVDWRRTVYAAVRVNASPPYGLFVKYPVGHTTPTTIYTFPAPDVPLGMAIDSKHNVYISFSQFMSGPDSQVLKFVGHSSKFTNLGIQNPSYTAPSGLAIDKQDNLLLVDGSGNVDVYPPGSSTPSQVFTGVNAYGGISFNANDTKLWVAGGILGGVLGVSYPTGTTFDTITSATALGVAASPEGAR